MSKIPVKLHSDVHILHGKLGILLDNIPIFSFGTLFGWKVKDSWRNFALMFVYCMVKWTFYWITFQYLHLELLWLKSQRFLTKLRSGVSILHGEMDISLDNIPRFLFGSPFAWNVKDPWQNLPTGQVVSLSSQLHSTKLQLRRWLHVDIFNQELCYQIDEDYNSSSSLIHPASSSWVTRMSMPLDSNLSRSTQPAQHDVDKNTL